MIFRRKRSFCVVKRMERPFAARRQRALILLFVLSFTAKQSRGIPHYSIRTEAASFCAVR